MTNASLAILPRALSLIRNAPHAPGTRDRHPQRGSVPSFGNFPGSRTTQARRRPPRDGRDMPHAAASSAPSPLWRQDLTARKPLQACQKNRAQPHSAKFRRRPIAALSPLFGTNAATHIWRRHTNPKALARRQAAGSGRFGLALPLRSCCSPRRPPHFRPCSDRLRREAHREALTRRPTTRPRREARRWLHKAVSRDSANDRVQRLAAQLGEKIPRPAPVARKQSASRDREAPAKPESGPGTAAIAAPVAPAVPAAGPAPPPSGAAA